MQHSGGHRPGPGAPSGVYHGHRTRLQQGHQAGLHHRHGGQGVNGVGAAVPGRARTEMLGGARAKV